MKKLFSILFILLALPGFAQNNYIIYHPGAAGSNSSYPMVRIFIDRAGNVYPPSLDIDSTKFSCKNRHCNDYANVEAYLTKYDTETARTIYDRNSVANFAQLQDHLVKWYASAINKEKRPLILLIHGFNDYAFAGSYDSLIKHIDNRFGKLKPLYVEVFWDGLKANTEKFKDVTKIWRRANNTAPYAALTLRKILAQVDTDVQVTIIAHSLGACVATRLLFTPHDRRYFKKKKEWLSTPSPPQSAITLSLIAPAIAGPRIFRHMAATVPLNNSTHYKKLVIGYSKHDYANTKKMRFPLSYLYFSTALGCNPLTVKRTLRVARNKCTGLKTYSTDLTPCGKKHHVQEFSPCAQFDSFIKQVMDD